jgi:hypothetical protein
MKPLEMRRHEVTVMVTACETLMELFPEYRVALVLNRRDGTQGGVIASANHDPDDVLAAVTNAVEARRAQHETVAFFQRDGRITPFA